MKTAHYPQSHANGASGGAANNERERSPDVTRVGGDIGELFDDISTLVELQFKLFGVDLKAAAKRAVAPIGLAAFGLVFLLGCVPVLLMGIAWVLVEQAEWSTGPALLAAAGAAALLGGASMAVGGLLLRNAGSTLDRSRAELSENIRWIKAAFNRRRIRERKLTP
jgi:hypothetical protein